jgi:YD repeat-containing protein
MKNIKSIIAFTVILFAIACSKSDDKAIENKPPSNYRMISDGYRSYDYNSEGKLIKYYAPTNSDYIEYSYDSKGRLTRINDNQRPNSYQYFYIDYVYDNDGKIISAITNYKNVGEAAPNYKYKTDYLYNTSGQVTRRNFYNWNNETSQYNPLSSYTLYEFNAMGKIIKMESPSPGNTKEGYDYDVKGNIIDVKKYDLKKGSATEYYLRTRYQYTYGDKKEPRNNIFPAQLYSEFPWAHSSPNFYLDEVTSYYNENGLTNSFTRTKPTYEYNDGGYPTKEVGGKADQYLYQKY